MSQFNDTVVFEKHYQDDVNTKYGQRVKHTFVTGDGTRYETWKAPVANVLVATMGQQVQVSGQVKSDGRYTNLDITEANLDIIEANPANLAAYTPSPAVETNEERQLRIMRQSGLERAILSFGAAGISPLENLDELLELSDQFVDYFVGGREAVSAVSD